MKSREYYANIQKAILAVPHVIQTDISFDEISEEECYIRGVLTLNGGYELHIAEYVVTEPEFKRLKYRFHLQTSDDKVIARWDNAPHHPEVKTHPDHLHVGDKIILVSVGLDTVAKEHAIDSTNGYFCNLSLQRIQPFH